MWQVKSATLGGAEYTELLIEGWEPFSVPPFVEPKVYANEFFMGPREPTIWLRKMVRRA